MRLSEIYPSVQGEGPRVGIPTTFVRFAGCNLKCPGWPCDTPHAIFPKEYRKQWKEVTVAELVEQTPMLPQNVCLTGGEPFLQDNDHLADYCFKLWDRGHSVEAFTNGTFEFPLWTNNIGITMDWKLSGSGEVLSVAQQMARIKNLDFLARYGNDRSPYKSRSINHGVVKFTLNDKNDLTEAENVWSEHMLPYEGRSRIPIYVGVVWESEFTNADLVDLMLKQNLPWRLTVQLHNHVWPAHERMR